MTSPTTRDRQIFAEQVRTLYAQLPVSVPAQIVGGALLVAAMWGQVSHPTLVLWCGLLCAFQVSRLVLYGAWRRRARPEENVERWRAWWATGAGLSGLVWGAAGFVMFVPDSPTHQAVLIVALLGVATGSITVIATDVTAFYAFSGAVVTPVLVRTAWEGGATYLVLAAIGAVVLAAILACGRNLSKELARSLAVYYQNLELIEELQAQKAIAERARNEAETANRAKTQFFASASHDLRQPLHAMGLFAAALAQKAHDPEVRHVVDSINSSVQALEALFSELLDIAKIDAGALKPVLAPFALADMFGRLQSDFEAEAAAKGLRLTRGGRRKRRHERRAPPRAHHPQPALERRALHDGGRGPADGRARRRRRAHRGERHGHRDTRGGPAADLRRVLPARQPGAHQRERHGPGALHRAAPVRAARLRARARLRIRPRLGLRLHRAARARPRSPDRTAPRRPPAAPTCRGGSSWR